MSSLPEELIARFRSLSFEKLERIEAAWIALTRGQATKEIEENLYRDLHTLKGDARVVGFTDVAVLCQRVEDLLFAARDKQYRVHEDVDIVLTMALQFVGMLLRKKIGAPRTGIDLEGFLKQIEEVITEWLRRSSEKPDHGIEPAHVRLREARGRIAPGAIERLSTAATALYLEHLRHGEGKAKTRLREIWTRMANELRQSDTIALRPWLEQHAVAVTELASELGKSVEVRIEVADDIVVGAQVLDAIGTTLVHTLRNAIDHGIEKREERVRKNKPERGSIAVRAKVVDEAIEVTVEDDGGGVDLASVRERAIALGIMTAAQAADASPAQLEALVFRAGFSTQTEASDVSGRGIGLDAARAAVERVGGRIALSSSASGVRVTIVAPRVRASIAIAQFDTPRGFRFAIPATWRVEDGAIEGAIDLEALLELPANANARAPIAIRCTRASDVVTLVGASRPNAVMAERLCATTDEDECEIVRVGDDEIIMIRPDRLARAQ